MLVQYHSSRESLSDENKRGFKEVQINDLMVAVEGFLPLDERDSDALVSIPYTVRRQAIDMQHLVRRSKEEIQLLEQEMMRVFLYYQNQERNVSATINQLSLHSFASSYQMGSISLLKSKQKMLQYRLLSMHSSLKSYITLPTIDLSQPLSTVGSSQIEDDNDSSASDSYDTSTDDSGRE